MVGNSENEKLRKTHWNKLYSTKDYTKVFWHEQSPKESLTWIQKYAKNDDAIIDVGCGASLLVDNLLANGYKNITILDTSNISLDIVKKRLNKSSVKYVCDDILNFNTKSKFEIWHDRAVFHFLRDVEDRKKYFQVLKSVLNDDAKVIISTFRTDGPNSCAGLDIVQYDYKKMSAELPDDLELLEAKQYSHITPNESKQEYIYFIIRNKL